MPESRTISVEAVEQMTVFVDGQAFKASYVRDKVVVDMATRKIAPAHNEQGLIHTREGTEVRRMLLAERVTPEHVEDVLAAALIVSALLGHPRIDGQAPRFIWTDHVGQVLRLDPDLVVQRYSQVKDPPGDHTREFSKRDVQVSGRVFATSHDASADLRADEEVLELEPPPTRKEPPPPSEDSSVEPTAGTRRPVEERDLPLEGYEYWQPEKRIEAEQRELALVARFRAFLRDRGREPKQEEIWTGRAWITYDLLDVTNRILFEAKADAASREQVRMAIGQLLDYAYHGFDVHGGPAVRKALLLPMPPPPDLDELLGYLGIGLAHETAEGSFHESYPWQ